MRTHSRVPAGIALTAAAILSAAAATAQPVDKQSLLSDSLGVLSAGNDVYTVFVDDGPQSGSCGTWTATTGNLHPAGSGLNVLFGNGFPGTSNTVLHSFDTGADLATGSNCIPICAQAPPVVTPVLNGAMVVGYILSWTVADAGDTIEFVQEVVVEGPVDGSETVENTVIRETHTVRNMGPGSFSFGLRKMWDWQIGPDDGPFFGECATPDQACDASMNLTADGSLDGPYPEVYLINEDPAVTACPAGVSPVGPNCGGNPLYVVAGTVSAPTTFNPPPDPPELVQFNSWPSLFSSCGQPPLVDNASCLGGDTALAYFYGLSMATAINLAAGQEESFTQYVVAAEDECPGIIVEPTNPLAIPALGTVGFVLLAVLLAIAGYAALRLRRRTAG